MRGRKIPDIYRNVLDNSITIKYGKPTCSLIWLHGLGDTSQGFLSFFAHSHSPLYENFRIKLIQAPLRSITLNNGQACNSWYDIKSLNRFSGNQEDVFNMEDIKESLSILQSHVDGQANQWYKQDPNALVNPYHKVFVGGFSQGGVIALKYGMQTKNIPAGMISFSGYMLRSTKYNNFQMMPTLLMHGENDQVIAEKQAKNSYKKLLTDQYLVDYKCIPNLQHSVTLQQLDELKGWFEEVNKRIYKIYENKNKSEKVN